MTELNLEKLKNGNKDEFKKLVESYQKPLYFFIFKILKDHDLSHDVLQESFVRVYKYLNNFKGKSTLKTWIFQIASNLSLTELKKKENKRTQSLEDQHIHLEDSRNIESDISTRQLHAIIEKSLSFLTPTQQLVFRLRQRNGLSTKEAAEHMNCSQSNVKKQLFLALKRIRNFIKKNYPEYNWEG